MARLLPVCACTGPTPALLLIGLWLGLLGGPVASPARASIRSDCEKMWTTNYVMVESCIKQQNEALGKLKSIPNDTIKRECQEDWGSNYIMVESCYRQQSGARQRLGAAEAAPPPGNSPRAQARTSGQAPTPTAGPANGCLSARDMIGISRGWPLKKRCPGGGWIEFNR